MKLTIKDRVFIPSLLPEQGSRLEMMTVKGIIDEIEFEQHEKEKWGIKQHENGTVSWNEDFEKEVNFSEAEKGLILDGIRKADKEGTVTLASLATIEKLYKILQ